MPDSKTTIEITTGTIIRALLLILLAVFLYWIREIVAVVLLAVVLASAVDPVARWFSRYRVPRVFSVILTYLLTFLVLVSAFYITVPPLFNELSDFIAQLPVYFKANVSHQYLIQFFPELPLFINDYFGDIFSAVNESLQNATNGFFENISSVFGGALSLVLIIILSFYLAVQEDGIENFLRIISPKEKETYVLDLWSRSRRKIGRWFQGQILLGILVGVLVFLGLTILQVKYALLLSILSAIFEIIPVFGPVMAAIPAVAVAFIQKPVLGLLVLAFYVIVQQFENHLIYPLVVKKTIGVNSILVILSLVIGGQVAGLFGFILAVPIAAVLMEIVNDIEKNKKGHG
ncbi:MAG: AI-2E family transporter [Candidatus Niyogibacteria bacterium]|nr:AI-2E family transporter [Candidatus Niyogibacteria bacterium]